MTGASQSWRWAQQLGENCEGTKLTCGWAPPPQTHITMLTMFKVLVRLMVTVFVTMSTRARQAGSKHGAQ